MFTHHEFEAVYEVLVTCYLLILDLLSNMEQYDMNQAFDAQIWNSDWRSSRVF